MKTHIIYLELLFTTLFCGHHLVIQKQLVLLKNKYATKKIKQTEKQK